MGWFSNLNKEEKEDGFVIYFPKSKDFLYDVITGERSRMVKRAWFFYSSTEAIQYADYYGGAVYSATKSVLHTEMGEAV